MATRFPTHPPIPIGGYCCLSPQQIVRLEADRNYTIIHQVGGRKFLVSLTLKTLEKRLEPYDFLRITRGDTINLLFIKKVGKDGAVLLADGTQICPSRRRQRMFKRMDKTSFSQFTKK